MAEQVLSIVLVGEQVSGSRFEVRGWRFEAELQSVQASNLKPPTYNRRRRKAFIYPKSRFIVLITSSGELASNNCPFLR